MDVEAAAVAIQANYRGKRTRRQVDFGLLALSVADAKSLRDARDARTRWQAARRSVTHSLQLHHPQDDTFWEYAFFIHEVRESMAGTDPAVDKEPMSSRLIRSEWFRAAVLAICLPLLPGIALAEA